MNNEIRNILGTMQDTSSCHPADAASDMYKVIYHSDKNRRAINIKVARTLILTYITYHRSHECDAPPGECLFERRLSESLDLLSESLHSDLNVLILRSRLMMSLMSIRFWISDNISIMSMYWWAAICTIITLILMLFS